MVRRRLSLSLAAVFLAVCLYYRGGLALLPTALLPVAAHELSHLLALKLLGKRAVCLRLEPRGLCIRYEGLCTDAGHILAALAGPLGGLVYTLAADALSRHFGLAWLSQSAGLSLLLTAFNLLPVLPLDGGQIFARLCVRALGELRGVRLYSAVSAAVIALTLLGGVALAAWKKASAPLAAGIWLLLYQDDEEILVNGGKII